ncbi:MAG: efflux RND transporter periplasmic adaptor subunit [Methylococcaceae bacterium]|nr:efflux RND transporter periplasmic adaptor subunit [Methylococcaceae bacterium]
MIKRMLIMLVMVGLVLGGVFGFVAFKGKMMKQALSGQGMPPQTVATAEVGYQDWQPRLKAVGTLKALRGTEISAEVAGIVADIHFKQGEEVGAGAPLVQLRADDDSARLQSLKAVADLARITLNRDRQQLAARAVSQQTVDGDGAALARAEADVAQQQALLNKKLIRAPFAGRLGLRRVDLGQYLEAGSVIATLQALDPIYLDFLLPQQELGAIRIGQPVHAASDAYPDERFAGEISVINPKVEEGSRNVAIRATLKNPGRKLLPGMFASLQIDVGQARRQLTVPRTAISFNPYGAIVYVVERQGDDSQGKPKLTARQSFVDVGESRGDQIAVTRGLNEGETVVTAGQIKLRNGTPLVVDNSIQPTADPDPKPEDGSF